MDQYAPFAARNKAAENLADRFGLPKLEADPPEKTKAAEGQISQPGDAPAERTEETASGALELPHDDAEVETGENELG